MLQVVVEEDEVRIGERFCVTFQRTLRIPDDGVTYPLPPGLGRFPVCQVEDFAERVPAQWREGGGVFIPMYQREALWLGFDGALWKPNAVQIAIGGVNAVSGTAWEERLSAEPQNYVVCPDQLWLDGINAGEGFIRQFVAMPLGMGYTVEAQLTGKEEFGGIQIRVYEPKPGRFPDQAPSCPAELMVGGMMASPMMPGEMGLGAGGKIKQKIYPDPYGLETWDSENFGSVFLHIVNIEQYYELTGWKPPSTPISAKTYTDYGFPWFELYDEEQGDVAASGNLANVKTVRDKDVEQGNAANQTAEDSLKLDPAQVKKLKLPKYD